MVPLGPVVVKTRVSAERTTVWAHLVRADLRASWWPELQLDPRSGGAVSESWSEGEGENFASRDATGEVDVLVEGHALGFRWKDQGDSRQTAVLITLLSAGAQTAVTVSETGFDALSEAAERAASSQEGWQLLLADLSAVSEASGNVIPAPPEEPVYPVDEPEAGVSEDGTEAAASEDGAEPEDIAGEGASDAEAPESVGSPGDTEDTEGTEVAREPETAEDAEDAVVENADAEEAAPAKTVPEETVSEEDQVPEDDQVPERDFDQVIRGN